MKKLINLVTAIIATAVMVLPMTVKAAEVPYPISRTEIVVGACLDNEQNGTVIDDFELIEYSDGNIYRTDFGRDEIYNYISYNGTLAEQDDIIITYLIMNPENEEPDDILVRIDKVIGK
jgi:hypothetical protein